MTARLNRILQQANNFYTNGKRTPGSAKPNRERTVIRKRLKTQLAKIRGDYEQVDLAELPVQAYELEIVALTVACAILNPCE